jgi:hypothetical protein
LDILTMHVPINVKSPNNHIWLAFNSAFKGLSDSQYINKYLFNIF